MSGVTTLTAALFCCLALLVVALVVDALRRVPVRPQVIVALFIVYLVAPAVLAYFAALDRYAPLPAPALLLLLGLTVLTISLTLSSFGMTVIGAIPLSAVVALQTFRVGVEWLLHRLYLEGAVPVQMTYAGRNFDVISGITGLLLGAWLVSGRSAPRVLILAWNIVGLALLANIVVIAVLSTPVPFRQFVEGPPNLLPSTFPFIWLPSFLVQVALGSHLLVFRYLKRTSAPA